VGTARKLTEVGQTLDSMTIREDFTHLLNDPGNVQTLNGLVEDIRYALMDYQVCSFQSLTLIISDVSLRLQCSRVSTQRTVSSL